MDNVQQQITEKLTNANNILVTVSANPTVDQLAACIGLTLLLNKMNKHATAVFSGKVPSTIEFLKPEETIETNTDSLRDFIISLDKAKADKLRYKVEDEVVKIFITPYKASISEKDLVYSQGDFNVDVVMALGVHQAQDLDNAITAHGRILHDAVVICVNTSATGGELGGINWVDATASGLSELVTILSTHLGQNGQSVLDAQIATALLTGIVAQTEHFSNQKTTPSTMTSSATLLTAGANQQLVAKELATPAAPKPVAAPAPAAVAAPAPKDGSNGELDVPHEAGEKPAKKVAKKAAAEKPAAKAEAPAAEKLPATVAPELETPTTNPEDKLAQRMKRIEPLPHDVPAPAAVIEPSVPAEPAAPAQPITKPILDDKSDDSLDAILKQNEAEVPQLPTEEPKPASEEAKPAADEPKPAEAPAVTLPEPTSPSSAIIEVPPAPEQIELPTPEAKPEATEAVEQPQSAPAVSIEPEKLAITLPEPAPAAAEPTPPAPVTEPETPAVGNVPGDSTDDDGQTLSQIEETVHSPHAEITDESDVDSARKAVEDALKQAPDQPLEPLEAIGAVNVNLNLGHEDAAQPAAPGTQPGPGVPSPAPAEDLPSYLQTPSVAPAPAFNTADGNMPPFEDLPSTPPPFGLQTPPPQVISPTGAVLPPQGPPPPIAPPPLS